MKNMIFSSIFLCVAFLASSARGAIYIGDNPLPQPPVVQEPTCPDPETRMGRSEGWYNDFSPGLTTGNPCVGGLGFAREYRFQRSNDWKNCPACPEDNDDCSSGCTRRWAPPSKMGKCKSSCPKKRLHGIEYCCKQKKGNKWKNMRICNKNNFDIYLTTKGGNKQYVWGKVGGGTCKMIDGNGGPEVEGWGATLSHVNICVSDCGGGGGGAVGDPHIIKWNGEYFDYHGECDLLLVDAPEFDSGAGLMVQIRTKQLEELGYSFIDSAAIRIGNDTLEIAGYGRYVFNGVAGGPLPQVLGNSFELNHTQPGEYQHEYDIDAGNGISIITSTLGEYVSIELKHSNSTEASEWLGRTRGLMGSLGGVLLARDGVTVMNATNDYGQEWQVQETEPNLFQELDRFPQHPQKCIPPLATADRRHLRGISDEDAESACAHVTNPQAKEACMFDVQATGDIALASIH